jgi:8-oxo-dGTP diphosphatase
MASQTYSRPALTADVVVIGRRRSGSSLLLVERAHEPFAGAWALPGGYVEEGERVAEAALRELAEETALELRGDRGAGAQVSLLGVYDTPGRDPRGWTVSVVYRVQLPAEPEVLGGDDARAARWWPSDHLPPLAFDHELIVADALRG